MSIQLDHGCFGACFPGQEYQEACGQTYQTISLTSHHLSPLWSPFLKPWPLDVSCNVSEGKSWCPLCSCGQRPTGCGVSCSAPMESKAEDSLCATNSEEQRLSPSPQPAWVCERFTQGLSSLRLLRDGAVAEVTASFPSLLGFLLL